MARTDGDSWDLASSVGATATMVAAARALASREPDAIIDDPFAEPLVRAVGIDYFTRMAAGQAPPADDATVMGAARMTANLAVRTKFFDEFFLAAAAAGIRQAVILASGLDSRAYRLAWPAGMGVYEIDQPDVVGFKTRTMAALGAAPTCDLRPLGIDLRDDWAAALREAGFDTGAPAVFSAEGLLGYLPPDAQDRLLDTVTGLSAPGSRIAMDSARPTTEAERQQTRERMKKVSKHWREQGFELDFTELTFVGERKDALTYLSDRGWEVHCTLTNDLLTAAGREPFDDDEPMAKLRYLSAVRDRSAAERTGHDKAHR